MTDTTQEAEYRALELAAILADHCREHDLDKRLMLDGVAWNFAAHQPDGSCYECANRELCYIRRDMDALVTKSSSFINIDSCGRPGKFTKLYTTLASCCLLYQEHKNE